MILEYLEKNWINHMSAGSGTLFSLLSGVSIIQSVIVGVIVYLVTHALSYVGKKVSGLVGKK